MESGAKAPLKTTTQAAAMAATLTARRNFPSSLLSLANSTAPPIDAEQRPSRNAQSLQYSQRLSGRSPVADARFRPSPATCDVSMPRSEDHRSMDGPALR